MTLFLPALHCRDFGGTIRRWVFLQRPFLTCLDDLGRAQDRFFHKSLAIWDTTCFTAMEQCPASGEGEAWDR